MQLAQENTAGDALIPASTPARIARGPSIGPDGQPIASDIIPIADNARVIQPSTSTIGQTAESSNTLPATGEDGNPLDPNLVKQKHQDDVLADSAVNIKDGNSSRDTQTARLVRRFNLNRSLLPAAAAVTNLSNLADDDDGPQPEDGVTRLPLNAKDLTKALHLPAEILTDEMLRNDNTGFRAAIYRDDKTGRLMLAARDTEPHSYIDWWTNIMNGMGILTPQYEAMIKLTRSLVQNNVKFDIVGYSKGGGLAQVAGLVSPNSKVTVFNSAGIPDAALTWTGAKDFDSLSQRTSLYSSKGEFLTGVNMASENSRNATEAYKKAQAEFDTRMNVVAKSVPPEAAGSIAKQLDEELHVTDLRQAALKAADDELYMAKWLRDQLSTKGLSPVSLNFPSPSEKNPSSLPALVPVYSPRGVTYQHGDPKFERDKQKFIDYLNTMIANREANKLGPALFPPVRAGVKQNVYGSGRPWGNLPEGVGPDLLGKLAHHTAPSFYDPIRTQIDKDRSALQKLQATP